MKKVQIGSFGVHQTAKTAGILYFFISLIIVPFFVIAAMLDKNTGFMGLFALLIPFLYAIIGYILTALSCLAYNFIASKTGGIEFTLNEV